MKTEIEKLETLRDVFTIASLIMVVMVLIMAISLIFINAEINKIYKQEIEQIKK